jgi:hypothetical protein
MVDEIKKISGVATEALSNLQDNESEMIEHKSKLVNNKRELGNAKKKKYTGVKKTYRNFILCVHARIVIYCIHMCFLAPLIPLKFWVSP